MPVHCAGLPSSAPSGPCSHSSSCSGTVQLISTQGSRGVTRSLASECLGSRDSRVAACVQHGHLPCSWERHRSVLPALPFPSSTPSTPPTVMGSIYLTFSLSPSLAAGPAAPPDVLHPPLCAPRKQHLPLLLRRSPACCMLPLRAPICSGTWNLHPLSSTRVTL